MQRLEESAFRGKRRRSRIPRPLVRVPIQRRTMTNTPAANTPAAALARALSPVWWETYAPHAGVRPADGGQGHFTLRGHMAENGTRCLREDHGDD